MPTTFRLALEGSGSDILDVIRGIEPRHKSGASPGPLWTAFMESRFMMDDSGESDECSAYLPLPDGGALVALLAAFATQPRIHWSVDLVIEQDGVDVWASLPNGRYGKPGEVSVTLRQDRKALLGSVMDRVREAQAALARAASDAQDAAQRTRPDGGGEGGVGD